MFKYTNRACALVLALVLTIVTLSPIVVTAASASDSEVSNYNSLYITAGDSIISRDKLINIFDELTQRLQLRLGNQYMLENFCFDFTERVVGNVLYVDIDVYFYMTLLQHPRYGSFAQGMIEVMQTQESEIDQYAVQSAINKILLDAAEVYYAPILTRVLYSISFGNINDSRMVGTTNYEIYYRMNSEDGILLSSVEAVLQRSISDNDAFLHGMFVAQEALASPVEFEIGAFSTRPTFRRLGARDWARANAYHSRGHRYYLPPDVPGTNCANFVSWALHNGGGLPQVNQNTSTQTWRSGWTSAGFRWPGDHWIRTGFHSNGGVTTYMVQRNWFVRETDWRRVAAGSIMFWTNTSHVALVTAGDTINVWFAENGARQSSNTLFNPNTHIVRFYVPNTSTLNVVH